MTTSFERRRRAGMRALLVAAVAAALVAAAAAESRSAPSAEPDRLTRRDGRVLEGEVVSLSLCDVVFLPRGEDAALQIPRAEIHSIRRSGARETEGGKLYGAEDQLDLRASYVREVGRKPYLERAKVTLPKKEIANRAILRGFLTASAATIFTHGDSKYIVFPAVFAGQFLLAYAVGL